MIKWTEDIINEFVTNESEYDFVEIVEYNGYYSKIIINCAKHGNITVTFANLKNNVTRNRCSCAKCVMESRREKLKLDYSAVKSTVENRGYELLSDEYKNNATNLHIKCLKCGYDFYMTYGNFSSQNQGCPKCAQLKRNEKNRYSYDYVKNYIESSGEYELLSDSYTNAHAKLRILCKKHNTEFLMTYHSFQQGRRCPTCGIENRTDKLRHSYDYVKNYIENNGDILLSDSYKNNLELLDIKCGKKGHIYKMPFGGYVSGHRCPCCNDSKGETEVATILESLNINYIPQHTFEDCKDIKRLRFDFYLPDFNTCIEFDGSQHYEPSDFFGGEKDFIDRQKKDNIKNEYCLSNNIGLIRIPYWDFDNIEAIIRNELKL